MLKICCSPSEYRTKPNVFLYKIYMNVSSKFRVKMLINIKKCVKKHQQNNKSFQPLNLRFHCFFNFKIH